MYVIISTCVIFIQTLPEKREEKIQTHGFKMFEARTIFCGGASDLNQGISSESIVNIKPS